VDVVLAHFVWPFTAGADHVVDVSLRLDQLAHEGAVP